MTTLGPIEYLLLRFPGNRFSGAIVPELASLVDRGLIHVIDFAFVKKDADGTVTMFEYDEIEELEALVHVHGEAEGLLSDVDLQEMAESLEPNSSAALLVWEDLWSKPFADALAAADGEVVAGGYVPSNVVGLAFAGLT